MDGQHPNQHDKRPKRRKDKDNPYELFTVGFGTPEPLYFIRFKDGQEIEHCMEIQKSLFDLLDSFELEDLSFLNERDRHYDRPRYSAGESVFTISAALPWRKLQSKKGSLFKQSVVLFIRPRKI